VNIAVEWLAVLLHIWRHHELIWRPSSLATLAEFDVVFLGPTYKFREEYSYLKLDGGRFLPLSLQFTDLLAFPQQVRRLGGGTGCWASIFTLTLYSTDRVPV
jgi:hypothetical protein